MRKISKTVSTYKFSFVMIKLRVILNIVYGIAKNNEHNNEKCKYKKTCGCENKIITNF